MYMGALPFSRPPGSDNSLSTSTHGVVRQEKGRKKKATKPKAKPTNTMPSSAYIRIIREQLQLVVFKAGFPTNVVEVPSVPPPAFPEIEIGPILAAASLHAQNIPGKVMESGKQPTQVIPHLLIRFLEQYTISNLVNICNDAIANCVSNGRKRLAPFVSPQERLTNTEREDESVASTWPNSDEENKPFPSHYNLVGWSNPSNAVILHNILMVAYLLNPKLFPFLHVINAATVFFKIFFTIFFKYFCLGQNRKTVSKSHFPASIAHALFRMAKRRTGSLCRRVFV